jgi:hypothetical protein
MNITINIPENSVDNAVVQGKKITVYFPVQETTIVTVLEKGVLFGIQGAQGIGVPIGGSIGQVLTKNSNNDYDTDWEDIVGGVESVNGKTGAVVLDKTDIGLGAIDNTSDANKPISNATQTALNGKQNTLTFTPEDVANKSTTLDTDKLSNTKYPSVKSVYDWVVNLLSTKQNNISISNNNGLDLTSNTLSSIYNTTIADSVNSVSVGGAGVLPASTWKTKNIVQVLDTILFPDQLPTYTIPTISISASQSGTKEIGQTISQAFVVSAVKNDAGIFTLLRAIRNSTALNTVTNPSSVAATDIAAQFGYSDPNNPNKSYTLSYTDSFVVVLGNTNWSGDGNYNAGLAKKNNKGVDDTRTFSVRNVNAPQAASNNFASASASINGIYPYFWGVSDTLPTQSSIAAAIAAGTANKVLSDASGTVTITFNATSKYLWMVHASGYTTKTKWYNTALNNGNIGASTDLFGAVVTQNVNSPDGYWSAVSFKMYISTFATTTSGSIEFRNT